VVIILDYSNVRLTQWPHFSKVTRSRKVRKPPLPFPACFQRHYTIDHEESPFLLVESHGPMIHSLRKMTAVRWMRKSDWFETRNVNLKQ
jgi:hypothetical protein